MFFLRMFTLSCLGILTLSALIITMMMAGVFTPSTMISQMQMTPCFPTAQSAAIVQGHKNWVTLRQSQDPDFVDPLIDNTVLMVEGDESSREWVLPGCVVERDPYGRAIVLKENSAY